MECYEYASDYVQSTILYNMKFLKKLGQKIISNQGGRMTEVSYDYMERTCLHILIIAFPQLSFKRKSWKILGNSTQPFGFDRTAITESGSINLSSMKSL